MGYLTPQIIFWAVAGVVIVMALGKVVWGSYEASPSGHFAHAPYGTMLIGMVLGAILALAWVATQGGAPAGVAGVFGGGGANDANLAPPSVPGGLLKEIRTEKQADGSVAVRLPRTGRNAWSWGASVDQGKTWFDVRRLDFLVRKDEKVTDVRIRLHGSDDSSSAGAPIPLSK